MATMNVSLPDPMKDWVETRIASGQYSSASDYVRDLIRHDQRYQDELQSLRKALMEGEASGVSKRTIDEIWSDVKSRHGLDV